MRRRGNRDRRRGVGGGPGRVLARLRWRGRFGERRHRLERGTRQAADDDHVERPIAVELGLRGRSVVGGDTDRALRLAKALESGGMEKRARLRSLGDISLFTSGFFSDSLRSGAVDVDYYVSMGEYAYGSLSRRDPDAFGEVFGELARKFVGYMDVLADVSERTGATRPDVLRKYEKILRTAPPVSKFIQ